MCSAFISEYNAENVSDTICISAKTCPYNRLHVEFKQSGLTELVTGNSVVEIGLWIGNLDRPFCFT